MEYSVPRQGDKLLHTIDAAYTRANDNATTAIEMAADADWLWGPEAGIEDYAGQNRLHHQLTGEIDAIGRGYRDENYWMCTDPVAKELIKDFPGYVHHAAQQYLGEARDPQRSRQERLIALDYAKQYCLTLFHAAQYPTRTRLLGAEEAAAVEKLGAAAEHTTRSFYASILGWEQETIDRQVEAAEVLLAEPSLSGVIAGLQPQHCKPQELDQPLTILLASLSAVDRHPNPDIIYALPAGGTQHAIVTRMLYGRHNPAAPEPVLHHLPISTHSVKADSLQGVISPSVELAIRQSDPHGKQVLICEDNSNSGTTISLATDVVRASSPASCHVSIVEFDPKRLEVKNRNLRPLGHVANFMHTDFSTAVGIVPITTGKYPDAQLRKVIPLRRQRHRARHEVGLAVGARTSYEEIPEDFVSEFNQEYKKVLAYCGDLHGYRNPYQVAAALVRHYEEEGILANKTLNDKYTLVQQMARAAIEYPYLPAVVRARMAAGEESLDYTPDEPWIRAGALNFMQELLQYSEEADSHVTIWTKGDGSYYSNPPYVGAEEQQLRFALSGLESQFQKIGFFDSGRGTFMAHPKKTPLLGTRLLPDMRRRLPHVTDVVIVDDAEKNLAEAAQQVRRYGCIPHPINPLVDADGRARLDQLALLAAVRYWGPNTAFIIDMDDTLLHEGFRKYHQPRNMALALLNAR